MPFLIIIIIININTFIIHKLVGDYNVDFSISLSLLNNEE
jgi:hypothetical protein